MRAAIRRRLCKKIPEFGDRVFDASIPGPETEKPYAVLRFGGESQSNIRMGFSIPVYVWPYVEVTNFSDVDRYVSRIIDALIDTDLVVGSVDENGDEDESDRGDEGYVFELVYRGTSDDVYDEVWKALTKQITFGTEVIRGG